MEKGIEATTTKDIARAAKVAEGSLYRHFPSKEDLAWHLFSVNLDALSEALYGRVLAVRDTQERVRLYVHECFERYEADPTLLHFLVLAEHRELKRYRESRNHPGRVLEQVIQEGQAAGALRGGDPWVLFGIIFGSVHRLCVVRSWGLIGRPLTELADETVAVVWTAVRA
ncbi:MAG: TetR/AcrR family transcriptional regulator [Elusimicrobia bacterium]|nr:TetR/AcrR family transcriptional regulator [Elusimicrobiota bacterium]